MINCIAYDVEVLPNFFSITFISLNDYLKVFKDCRDSNDKAIPLVQKLSVVEIKDRLSKVKSWQYYITDTDDTQLIPLIGFINSLRIKEENGIIIRNDLYGFNSKSYDKLMVAGLLSFFQRYDTPQRLCKQLYELSKKIITNQDDKNFLKNDFQLQALRKYPLPYIDVDVMRIFALNKVSVIEDKDGNRHPVGKSLKQTSINLQWYNLLEYNQPDICDKDIHYYHENDFYRGMTAKQLNKLISVFDRYVLDEYIPNMMIYNKNDVFIVCEIVRLNPDEVKSRYTISHAYNVDVLSASRSSIADILFEKFYTKFSGVQPKDWKGKQTIRTIMSFDKVIFPNIQFKTKELQQALAEMKKVKLTRVGKDAFTKNVTIGNLTYTIATGGLHTQDIPMEIWSTTDFLSNSLPTGGDKDRKYTIYHVDVASFYPRIMAEYMVAPEHLNAKAFAAMIRFMMDRRVYVKHSDEEYVDGIAREIYALVLKIVINSIYGKFGYEFGETYDRMATLKVTINGQLMLIMLCEALELAGIRVLSGNTDGIMIKVYEDLEDTAKQIIDQWQKDTKMLSDVDVLDCLIERDINNYIAMFRVDKKGKKSLKREFKGDYDPFQYLNDLKKGYSMPIVAKAVENYFIDKIPIMETLQNCTNILDFCLTQNVGKQFNVHLVSTNNGVLEDKEYQRYVRYYVTNKGATLWKVHKDTDARSQLSAGNTVTIINELDDTDISLRDINFRFYYNECMKMINPIKLAILPKGKGKTQIKKHYGQFKNLFDEI